MTALTEKRIKIGVYLTPSEIEQLENQASLIGTSRGTLIRDRALQTSNNQPQINCDPALYAKAVEACAQAIPGASRIQIEHATAKVIIAISA